MEAPSRPIVRIGISDQDYTAPESSGGPKKQFVDVTNNLRSRLTSELNKTYEELSGHFEKFPTVPGVAHVRLRTKAWAKSHRPTWLFNADTCPIIGSAAYGELLVRITPSGVESLKRKIAKSTTKIAQANISTLDAIWPHRLTDVLHRRTTHEVVEDADSEGVPIQVMLFDHHEGQINSATRRAFENLLSDLGVTRLTETLSSYERHYLLRIASSEVLKEVGTFASVQSMQPEPRYEVLEPQAQPVGQVTPGQFPAPDGNHEYLTVGVVDTGSDPGHKYLGPWRAGGHSFVSRTESDFGHGTFVTGLLVNARRLNHGDDAFPVGEVRFLDCQVLGKNKLSEHELVTGIEQALDAHPDVRIWNLSLGASTPCDEARFSSLAKTLDSIQDDKNVLFVIAAGNYQTTPLRAWPVVVDLKGNDRVGPPADSMRAITVGSVAGRETTSCIAGVGDPSPFSRRGPGPSFSVKPELVHIGGNCDDYGNFAQAGVLSVDEAGALAEDIGTSFAAPLIASLCCDTLASITPGPGPWQNLTKSLLIHSAALSNNDFSAHGIQYKGFGMPTRPDALLGCDSHLITLAFEGALVPGVEFERHPLPLPPSLVTNDNRFTGEIIVTLVASPELDGSYGSEYTRTNIEVSVGTYDADANGKVRHKGKVPVKPTDARKLYEAHQVEFGFKWSPVKVYQRTFTRGVRGQTWRLVARLNERAHHASTSPEPFVALLTIRDPSGQAPVYDEAVREMATLGWQMSAIHERARVRIQN